MTGRQNREPHGCGHDRGSEPMGAGFHVIAGIVLLAVSGGLVTTHVILSAFTGSIGIWEFVAAWRIRFPKQEKRKRRGHARIWDDLG